MSATAHPNIIQKELQSVLEAPPADTSTVESHSQQEELSTMMANLNVEEKFQAEDQAAEEPQPESHLEEQQEYYTRDFIEVSKSSINFDRNMLYPGSIDEVELSIGLRQDILPDEDPNAAYLLRIVALCNNVEFNELDEYVFSVRSNERYEYYEEVRFRIKKREKAQVRVAVKVPVVNHPYTITGNLTIQLENTIPLVMPINCKSEMPHIICMKELFDVGEGTPIIKIPAKKSMRIPPIPFKNNSSYNFVVEVETATTSDFSERPYDIIAQNTANCLANTPFFVNLQLKSNMNYQGVMPVTDTIRKILILKVKNSSVFYSYPIEAYVFESTTSSSVS